MCNRFSAAEREAINLYGREIIPYLMELRDWNPLFNIPPTSLVPCLIADKTEPGRLLQWGTQTHAGLVMNARSETILEKPLWKAASQTHRCVMLADGFFEWETVGKRKLGHHFTIRGRRPFALAGLWFEPTEHQPARVVMVTCEPNSLVAPYHDRMPAMLTTADAQEWLTPGPLLPDTVARLCRPFPVAEMDHWRSPPDMNRNSYQERAAIEPWQPAPDLFG